MTRRQRQALTKLDRALGSWKREFVPSFDLECCFLSLYKVLEWSLIQAEALSELQYRKPLSLTKVHRIGHITETASTTKIDPSNEPHSPHKAFFHSIPSVFSSKAFLSYFPETSWVLSVWKVSVTAERTPQRAP